MAISVDAAGRNLRKVPGTNIAVATPWVLSAAELKAATKAVLGHADVKAALGKNRSRLLSLEPVLDLDKGPPLAKPTRFKATLFDYAKNRALIVHARPGKKPQVEVSSRRMQPLPSTEEWTEALEILRGDKDLGGLLASGEITPYEAMPSLSEKEGALGEVERALHVGLRPKKGSGFRHTIVAVNLIRRVVERYESGSPPCALAQAEMCGAPDGVSFGSPPRGTQGSLWIGWPADNPIWTFLAVRPAQSSGTRGSGIEILYADYNGQRVFFHGHVPILNVQYDLNRCGPFRDWQWAEHIFVADGTNVVPGFRWCTSPPQTIIDNESDAGNFNGVAVYDSGDSLLLVSEMEAGWYRYISEWTFHQAGWVEPRFKFAAVGNNCVCNTHNHHCYWRFDFDIGGSSEDIVEEWNNSSGWQRLTNEVRRNRDQAGGRKWRVRDATSSAAWDIIPGAEDGTAQGDAYARGDAWFLRYRGSAEYDDGYNSTGGSGTPADLDKFVTGESIDRADVVVWYGGHFRHQLTIDHPGDEHTVGPNLMPPMLSRVAGKETLTLDDLRTLDRFRDRELGRTPAGKRYLEKLRQHNDELLQMVLTDERVKHAVAEAAKKVAQAVRDAGAKAPPPVSAEVVEDLGRVLKLVEAKGSDALKAAVASAREDLAQLRGTPLKTALGKLAGPR